MHKAVKITMILCYYDDASTLRATRTRGTSTYGPMSSASQKQPLAQTTRQCFVGRCCSVNQQQLGALDLSGEGESL